MEDNRLTIKGWAEADRPREKLLLKGKSALSDAELIAILIGSGNTTQSAVELSQHILSRYENSIAHLAKLSVKDLQKFKGIGEAKAITILAALELGKRRKDVEPKRKSKIITAHDAFNLMEADLMDLPHEEFWLILLKRNNEFLKKEMISRGGLDKTVVDPRIIFRKALEELASGLVLVHNHPSGGLRPSQHDISLTKKLKEAGKSLDIAVLDHLIIAEGTFFSFAEENML